MGILAFNDCMKKTMTHIYSYVFLVLTRLYHIFGKILLQKEYHYVRYFLLPHTLMCINYLKSKMYNYFLKQIYASITG